MENRAVNVALLTGRAGSESLPGKNMYPILGRPLAYYPMKAAKDARLLDAVYVSTDSKQIIELALDMGVSVIQRPPELSHNTAELVDALTHALEVIGGEIDILVTMHCNCAVHRPGLVDACIEKLVDDPQADSCVSGSTVRSVHPYRTRRIGSDGALRSWMDVPANTSSNRQALDGCFVLDGAARALRVERCFPPSGSPPFTYLGKRSLPIENLTGGDVHSLADVAVAEHLLGQLGWSAPTTRLAQGLS